MLVQFRAFAVLALSCVAIPVAAADDDVMQIYVIDVGQGDSTLIVGPVLIAR